MLWDLTVIRRMIICEILQKQRLQFPAASFLADVIYNFMQQSLAASIDFFLRVYLNVFITMSWHPKFTTLISFNLREETNV